MAATSPEKPGLAPGRWIRSSAGMASAGIGFIASLLSIVFLVWPSLQPDEAPAALSATLSNAVVEQQVTMGSVYERRQIVPDPPRSDEELQILGSVIRYDVLITGYEGEFLSIRWSMLDADTLVKVEESGLVDQPGWPDVRYQAEAESDQASGELWVTNPANPGNYVVRIELLEEDGTQLSTLDSPTITIADVGGAPSSSQPPAPGVPVNPTPSG